MRRILVDAARARGSRKRGGDAVRVDFDEGHDLLDKRDATIVALDEALEAFSKVAPRQAKVLELRYFGGLNIEEINEVLGIEPRTIERDWQFAKSWLTRDLTRAFTSRSFTTGYAKGSLPILRPRYWLTCSFTRLRILCKE